MSEEDSLYAEGFEIPARPRRLRKSAALDYCEGRLKQYRKDRMDTSICLGGRKAALELATFYKEAIDEIHRFLLSPAAKQEAEPALAGLAD